MRWFTTLDGRETEVESGEPFNHKGEIIVPKSRTFIPARVEDNPYYMASGYKATLQSLPEPLRSKLLYGDFGVGRGEDPCQIIPTLWIEQAIARFERSGKPTMPLSCIGVDVARGGNDRTVLTLRYGNWFEPQRVFDGRTTPNGNAVAQLVLAARGASACCVNIDVIGVGASAFDALHNHIGNAAQAMNAAQASNEKDKSQQLAFVNKRAEWWWLLRESLDPASDADLALPPDRELLSDLTAPRYSLTVRGILVESKTNIIKRLGRSPDKGDSLVLAHAISYPRSTGFLQFYASENVLR